MFDWWDMGYTNNRSTISKKFYIKSAFQKEHIKDKAYAVMDWRCMFK